MNRFQKVNLLKSTKREFQARLNELLRTPPPVDQQDRMEFINRKDSLSQAIHFCNYLIIFLKRNNDFKPENNSMLEFIGLEDL